MFQISAPAALIVLTETLVVRVPPVMPMFEFVRVVWTTPCGISVPLLQLNAGTWMPVAASHFAA